jgi:hypothetical protein
LEGCIENVEVKRTYCEIYSKTQHETPIFPREIGVLTFSDKAKAEATKIAHPLKPI